MGDRLRRVAAGKALLHKRVARLHVLHQLIVALLGKGHEHGEHAVLRRSEEAMLLLHALIDALSALGGLLRVAGPGLALEIVDAFLNEPFSNDPRHVHRLELIDEIAEEFSK